MNSPKANSSILRSDPLQENPQYVESYYSATANPQKECSQLDGDISADVCIIGGGFTGLSTALHLAERGVDVVLLEAEKIAWGASGRNGGHVGTGQRVGQEKLESRYGKKVATDLWNLGLDAANLVRSLVEKHQINCDLKQGILHVAAKASDVDGMKQDIKRLQNDYGYDRARFVDKSEVDDMLGTNQYFSGELDMGSMHLHPLNYALGLADAARNAGAKIFEQSRVLDYKIDKGGNGETIINTAQGRVTAKTMVLACNGYLDRLAPKMAAKIMPINNFILATEPLSDELAKQLIRDDVAVQDSLFVINYWKLSGDNRLILGGGENYTSRFPTDMKQFVRKYMLKIYPQLESTTIDYAWGGTLAITLNRMPHFGRLAPNVLYAHGYSGHGVPTATMAGKMLADAISGDPQQFDLIADLPTPSFPGGTLLRWPGLVVGMLYHSMLDKL